MDAQHDWAFAVAATVNASLEGSPYIADDIERIAASLRRERERCEAIVQAARAGEIDQDFRSIIHRIKSGSTDHVAKQKE